MKKRDTGGVFKIQDEKGASGLSINFLLFGRKEVVDELFA